MCWQKEYHRERDSHMVMVEWCAKIVEMLLCSDGVGRGSHESSRVIWTSSFGSVFTHLLILDICRSRLFINDAQ